VAFPARRGGLLGDFAALLRRQILHASLPADFSAFAPDPGQVLSYCAFYHLSHNPKPASGINAIFTPRAAMFSCHA
jgi:hypothetical protein